MQTKQIVELQQSEPQLTEENFNSDNHRHVLNLNTLIWIIGVPLVLQNHEMHYITQIKPRGALKKNQQIIQKC